MTQTQQTNLERRQKFFLAAAWISILVPLCTFAYFAYMTYDAQTKLETARKELAGAQTTLNATLAETKELQERSAKLGAQISEQEINLKEYRNKANIRIQYYRDTDFPLVEKVAKGLKVPMIKAESRLTGHSPNAIYYSNAVSEQDIKNVAVTFIESGFPLRLIDRATRNAEGNLIQVVGSDRGANCGLLSVEDVRAGKTCGNL